MFQLPHQGIKQHLIYKVFFSQTCTKLTVFTVHAYMGCCCAKNNNFATNVNGKKQTKTKTNKKQNVTNLKLYIIYAKNNDFVTFYTKLMSMKKQIVKWIFINVSIYKLKQINGTPYTYEC